MSLELYFAYGSNLRSIQMLELCPEHTFLGAARLDSYRLDFSLPDDEWQGGVADIVFDSNQSVWGGLYKVTSADIASLDIYEGCTQSESSAYRREVITVSTSDCLRHSAWCYIVRHPQGYIPPSPIYCQALISGAHERALPLDYIQKLEQKLLGL